MNASIELGKNVTGTHMAPQLTKEMIEGLAEFPPTPLDLSITLEQFKEISIREALPLGHVPTPTTVMGTLSTGFQKLMGKEVEVLLDELGGRLAFERGGVRLYEALIAKCQAQMGQASQDFLERLERFKEEETQHFFMVKEAIEKMGGDPTAQTLCADVGGVSSMGLMQVLTDPRTTLPQCVYAILVAEMADNAAWDILVELTKKAGMKEAAENFEQAKRQEDEHLEFMQSWWKNLLVGNGMKH